MELGGWRRDPCWNEKPATWRSVQDVLRLRRAARRSAGWWNVVVGHLVGLTAGYLALAPLHVSNLPATFALHALLPVRVWASALAVALTLFGQIVTRSSHPPAAATTLLVAPGGFRATVHDASAVVGGILVVAAASELLRFVHPRAG